MDVDEPGIQRRMAQIGRVFTPSAPVADQALFAGRNHELFTVVEAMQSSGQHAVIYGERGVGKTSLARIALDIGLTQDQIVLRVNCEATDDFDAVWVKVADELEVITAGLSAGRRAELDSPVTEAAERLRAGQHNANSIRVALRGLTRLNPVTVFFDEFNELADSNAIIAVANTIKTISDHIEPITLCPVGVAEDLDALLEGHLSSRRGIAQVKMPRMSHDELSKIVNNGLEKLDMSITDEAMTMIRVIPRGLPQYAHLLALEGARQALLAGRAEITNLDVMEGLVVGLSKMDRSLTQAYEQATYSPRKTRLAEVLLACAIARLGDMGDFSPVDIREPYSRIIGESVGIDRFNPQLTTLATKRDILMREGEDRRWRYRFRDPLMEPYVLLQGLKSGAITTKDFPPDLRINS